MEMITLPIVTVDGIRVHNIISAYTCSDTVWYWDDENFEPHPKTDCVELIEIEGPLGQLSKFSETKHRARIRGGEVKIEWRGLQLESYTA